MHLNILDIFLKINSYANNSKQFNAAIKNSHHHKWKNSLTPPDPGIEIALTASRPKNFKLLL